MNKRIENLRAHALGKEVPGIKSEERQLLWYRGWLQNQSEVSNIVRRAKTKAYVLKNSTPVIDEEELLVGKPCYRRLTNPEQEEFAALREYAVKASPRLEGQDSHMAIDYEKLLKNGITGVQHEIQEYRQNLQLHIPQDMEKDDFYRACLDVLEGVLEYAENYSCYAEELANSCSEAVRKNELLEISRICKKVPRYPADTLHEALQSVHFLTFCMEGLYQLGRPDRYLIEYYRKDLQSGILTPVQAQELIDCLCILFNEYIPRGLAVGFMVGGRDGEGKDVTNELTYHFIESIGHTRMIYPGIGLCYTKDTPQDLLVRCCELLAEGLSHPALFNDEVITRGLISYGLPPKEACLYIHSTCVEITPISSSAVWVASPYINLVEILLELIGVRMVSNQNSSQNCGNAQLDQPHQRFSDFEVLKQAYRTKLGEKIRQEVILQNRIQKERYYHGGAPLVSCFVNDCIARGMDIDQGGARYNWIMPSFVGLANLVDSLMTIKRLVFEEQKISMEQLAQILMDNYQGQEDFRLMILNRIPKYGNDEDIVDELIGEVTGWILHEIRKHQTYRGDRFIPSLFCWVMHEKMGSVTPASPDGRKRGFPLGDGSGPAQGREKKGPTASILSATKWEHAPFIGGIAVNMKFEAKWLKGESLSKMLDLIRTFMDRGGFEIQINVVSGDTLIKARENPEQYRDLVVRIGGYSDYFVHLSPEMQEEIILRTQHKI